MAFERSHSVRARLRGRPRSDRGQPSRASDLRSRLCLPSRLATRGCLLRCLASSLLDLAYISPWQIFRMAAVSSMSFLEAACFRFPTRVHLTKRWSQPLHGVARRCRS